MTFSQVRADILNPAKRLALGLALAFGLIACGGGGGSTAPSGPKVVAARLTMTVHIPKNTASSASNPRRPEYISSALQSIDFRLTAVSPTGGGTYSGSLNTDTLVLLTYANTACTTDADGDKTCTATTTAPAPATDTWTIYTYDTTTPTVGTTTPLSIYAAYPLPITVAGPNTASVSTWGVPAALAFSPASVSNVANNVSISGAPLTTTVQVKDAGGATLIGGENFSNPTGTAGSVAFTGCDAHLTPTPAILTAANPTALGAGTISVAYDGLASGGTTLKCDATAPGGLTAQYSVNLITGTGNVNWTVQ